MQLNEFDFMLRPLVLCNDSKSERDVHSLDHASVEA